MDGLPPKWYVVTGGSSGIGLATSRLLKRSGYAVVNVSRSPAAECQDVADVFLQIDLIDLIEQGAADRLRENIAESGVRSLAGCFLAAGGGAFVELGDAEGGASTTLVTINLISPYLCIKALRPLFCTGASVVLCGSAVVRSRVSGGGLYAAAKAGLESLTRTLASELGPHIRVNCVAPGAIDTPLFGKHGLDLDAIKAAVSDKIPLARFGRADEVASVVGFLLSDAASYVSGSVIDVHGGGLPQP